MVWIYCDDRIPNLWMRKYNLPERLKTLRYLFRVDHDESPSRYIPTRGFVARKFVTLPDEEIQGLSPSQALADRVVRSHVLAKPIATPWISTTESWFMAVWHATVLVERGHSGVHVSVISMNGADVEPRRAEVEEERRYYAIDLLRRGKSPALSNSDLTTEEQWATVFQQILVFGRIPEEDVIARVPIEDVVEAMPSSFFHDDASPSWQNLVWLQNAAKRDGEIRNPAESIEASMRTWSEHEIGRASARLAIASLHIPPCSIRQYRDDVVSLARHVAGAFSSTRPAPEAWVGILHGIDDHIRDVHQEFVRAVQLYMMEELEQAQQSLAMLSQSVTAIISTSFDRQPAYAMGHSPRVARREARTSLVSTVESFESSLMRARDILRRLTPTNDRERSAVDLIIGGMQSLALPHSEPQ